jgi:alkyl hydroperoxide reductase subunit AhpC
VYSKYQNKGFIIISVSMDTQDKKQDWIAAIKNDSLKWVQICDFKGWSGEVVNMYNLYGKGIPSNFLINPNGLILAKDLHGEDLAKKLKELFN